MDLWSSVFSLVDVLVYFIVKCVVADYFRSEICDPGLAFDFCAGFFRTEIHGEVA